VQLAVNRWRAETDEHEELEHGWIESAVWRHLPPSVRFVHLRVAAQGGWISSERIRRLPARAAPRDLPLRAGPTAWWIAVDSIRAAPALKESVLASVESSMAFEGFELDDRVARTLLDEALSGPPLVHPDDE